MSDLYDSLEDERDEYNLPSDSMGRRKTHSSDSVMWDYKSNLTENYSFFLNPNINTENHSLRPIIQFSNVLSEKKNFLPQINNFSREKGPESESNAVVNNKSLSDQGLQFNDDGSFTKSPRLTEELPFITREYRNLQFQKKKTYRLNNKSSAVTQQKKNIFSFTDPSNGINVTQQIIARKKKGSNEELLSSERSLFCKKTQRRSDKQSNYNLTDSMKEKLWGTFKSENQPNKLKSIKLISNSELQETNETRQQNKTSTVGRRKINRAKSESVSPTENFHGNSSDSVSDVKKSKNVPQKISKYNSDILLNGTKPKLNYSERHQLMSGFKPICLRRESKRIASDTNRSNFGDSEMEELPEVSSRVMSSDNLRCEEEEKFYMKLIEEDLHQKRTQKSSRSEGGFEQLSLKRITGVNSDKGGRETMSVRSNSKCKHNSKSMFIDMPSEKDHSASNLKKFSHYCSTHSSPNVSKTELALKAKTYGYLANARNIFKLKAQSEGKRSATEREKQNVNENVSPWSKKPSDLCPRTSGKLTKQYSLPVNGFSNFRTELPPNSPKFPRGIGSARKPQQLDMSEGSPKRFVLPQLNNHNAEVKGGKMNARLFERINNCLKGPNV